MAPGLWMSFVILGSCENVAWYVVKHHFDVESDLRRAWGKDTINQ